MFLIINAFSASQKSQVQTFTGLMLPSASLLQNSDGRRVLVTVQQQEFIACGQKIMFLCILFKILMCIIIIYTLLL